DERRSNPSHTILDQLFERLTTLSNQLESAVELSSTLQAQHTAAQSTISALESKVTALEDLVRSSHSAHASSPIEVTSSVPPDPAINPEPAPSSSPPSESLTRMLNEWK